MRGVMWSPTERARLIAAFKTSGMNPKAFAEYQQIPFSTLYQWLAKESRPPARVRLARVLRKPSAPDSDSPAGPSPTVVVEVGAARIHVATGFDRDTLRSVLDLLETRQQPLR